MKQMRPAEVPQKAKEADRGFPVSLKRKRRNLSAFGTSSLPGRKA
jgi:hypothetical protein